MFESKRESAALFVITLAIPTLRCGASYCFPHAMSWLIQIS